MCSPSAPAAPTSQSVTQTSIPEYARPYVETMLGKQQALGDAPFTAFPGGVDAQVAGFSDLQRQSQSGIAGLQMPGQFGQAAAGTQTAMDRALGAQYNPTAFGANQTSAPSLNQYGMNAPTSQAAQFQGSNPVGFQNVGAERVNAPQLNQLSMQAAGNVSGPNLQNFQMGNAQQLSTQDFNSPGTASQFMNPYLQQSLEPQIAEAQRQSGIQRAGIQSQATQQGAFGGGRQAIMESENNRNLGNNISNIVGQGFNNAFNQAQNQFNTQQQRDLQAQQGNQQAGLTVGQQNLGANLQTQGLGAQFGQQAALANQSNQQQANLQNLSAGLQTQGLSAQTGLQAQGMNQSTGLQALLANQQAGLQAGQFNATNQFNTAAQNAQLQQQTNLANQQSGLTAGQQNLQSQLNTQQLGAGQDMQSQLANQSANQQAAQLEAQQQQFGANFGMQGITSGMQGAVNLANIGNQSLGAQQNILASQGAAGAQQQAQEQARMAQSQRNFDQQINYPQQQLNNMSNMLRGLPMAGTGTAQTYQAPPSALSQLGGLGAAAYGVSQIGRAKGGSIKEKKRPAGLAELALSRMA